MEFNYNGHSKSGGIYSITNKINGRIYYGSCAEFKARWTSGHRNALLAGTHSNPFMLADFNKCGLSAFVFNILEVIAGTKDERLAREQLYLDNHWDAGHMCYNIAKQAKSPAGSYPKDPALASYNRSQAQKNSPKCAEARRIKAEKQRGTHQSTETIEKRREAMMGHKVTEETRTKLSAKNTGRSHHTYWKGKKRSEETVAKIMATRKAKYNPLTNGKAQLWCLISPAGIPVMIKNMTHFCKENGLVSANMLAVYRGTRKSHNGWTKVFPYSF